jgi:hypothetical protein
MEWYEKLKSKFKKPEPVKVKLPPKWIITPQFNGTWNLEKYNETTGIYICMATGLKDYEAAQGAAKNLSRPKQIVFTD